MGILHQVDGRPVFEDYWSSEGEVDVFYHGFYRLIEDIGYLVAPASWGTVK